jgi:hypothetical protein
MSQSVDFFCGKAPVLKSGGHHVYPFIPRRGKRAAQLLAVIVLLASSRFLDARQTHATEQLEFSAEDPAVKNPVAIPDQVLAVLRQDRTVASVLENQKIQPRDLPSSWFSASAIHLSKSGREDLVVVGEPPVSGGSGALFWVFLRTEGGYRLALAAAGHDLLVRKSYSNGYRNIELVAMTAEQVSRTLCRFDGQRYRRVKMRSNPIR